MDTTEHPHRRLNVLSGKFILCSPHRAKRPWQGQVEKIEEEKRPQYDPKCFLCPRNTRATSGIINPDYAQTFVFPNDFPSFLRVPSEVASSVTNEEDLLVAKGTDGECHVICFSPDHSATLAEMDVASIRSVVDTWQAEFVRLSSLFIVVQIFENKGPVMGCSNPHAHGQLWATDTLPNDWQEEVASFASWKQRKNSCLLCDYLNLEKRKNVRIVASNQEFTAVVPYWAYWPYETLIIPHAHLANLEQLNDAQKDALADILRLVTCKYDNLFEVSFPYSLGIHQLRLSSSVTEFHMHIHIHPPLLRSATVKKFEVGYELFAERCRDITAEQAAERLAALPIIHYKNK